MEEKKVKVFLSIPMRGRTLENFMYTVERIKEIVKPMINKNHDITDFVFITGNMSCDDKETISDSERVRYLGESISRMAECNYVVEIQQTPEYHRGCSVEDHVAREYGFKIINISCEYVYSDEELEEMLKRQTSLYGCVNQR